MRSAISLILICIISTSSQVFGDEQVTCDKAAKAIELLRNQSLNQAKVQALLGLISKSPACDNIEDLYIYKSLYRSENAGSNCIDELDRLNEVVELVKNKLRSLIIYVKDRKLNLLIACESKIDQELEREVKQLYWKYFWNFKIGVNIKRLSDRIYPLAEKDGLDVTDQDFIKGFVAYYVKIRNSAKSKSIPLESDVRSVLKDLTVECQRIRSKLIVSTKRLLQFDDRAQLRQMDDFIGSWVLRSKKTNRPKYRKESVQTTET